MLEFGSQRLEIRNLAVDLCNMLGRDVVDLRTRSILIVGQPEQRANLLDREAQVAGATDERQPPEMPARINA